MATIEMVSWNSGGAAKPEVALSALLGKAIVGELKCFTVVADGDVWRWRVSWPQLPGKCAMVSTTSYPTRADAERAAQLIAHVERPSICMLDAWQETPTGEGWAAYEREILGV